MLEGFVPAPRPTNDNRLNIGDAFARPDLHWLRGSGVDDGAFSNPESGAEATIRKVTDNASFGIATSRPTDQCIFSRPSRASPPTAAKPLTSVRPRTTSSFRSAAYTEFASLGGSSRMAPAPPLSRRWRPATINRSPVPSSPFSTCGTSLRPGQPNRTLGSLRHDWPRGGSVRGSPSVRKPIPWSSCQ